MNRQDRYDVIIIGTGAGGGTLAHRLAPSGKRILLLERGDFLPREKDNWSPEAVLAQNKYKAHDAWLDKDGKEFHPGTHYCVGGNTKFYGAALIRFRKEDFAELRHHGGVSPAWPIAYEDLAPYYTRAEHLYQVRGQRGVDPTEPPCDDPYPFPPVAHEPRIQELHDDFSRLGLHPFHVPLGVRLDERDMVNSACIRCNTCDGYPCMVNAKSDADVTCVRPAVRRSNVTLLTRAKAVRLETSPSGREVRRVVVERDGAREVYEGDLVVVACGAVNSAALLLASACDAHPNGLANGSDQVGRNYMCHNNTAMLAISRKPNPTIFQKTIAVNDFYFGAHDWGHPMGHISMVGKSDAVMLAQGAPPGAPRVVLTTMAGHSLDFWMTSEDLPHPDNRVTVGRDGRISLRYTPNNEEAHAQLFRKLKGMLKLIGCDERTFFPNTLYLGKKIPLAGVAHQCGTCRMGDDPATSVLDVNCKAHELDNLYVADSSFFVSSSAVNPALTIIANALRVGDHLLDRLGVVRSERAVEGSAAR
jgi:choline dehydrogenase-like flavoprotein